MKKAFRNALESEGVIIDENRELPSSRPLSPQNHISNAKSLPASPRINKKETAASTEIHRRNSDQLLKSEVGTTSDPRTKFQQRRTVSTPSLHYEEEQTDGQDSESKSIADSSASTLDSSRSQQSSFVDSDSVVIRSKKRFNISSPLL